jgi:Domain of unknown function (DUF5655)/Domain of unknown function (DUF4287)
MLEAGSYNTPMPRSLYSLHPGLKMIQSSMRLLEERTGKSAKQWAATAKRDGPAGSAARREWLKTAHGFTTNYARWIADLSAGEGLAELDPEVYLQTAERYVEAMFSGKRAALRPVYDRLLALALSLGKDVKACPGKTIVPLYREHVFAQIKPATNTRIDLGLALSGTKPTGRLIDTGGFAKKDRITHRIEISSIKDIDAEVTRWLKKGYEGN